MKIKDMHVDQTGLEMFLGPLQAACMRAVWAGHTGTKSIWLAVREHYTSGNMRSDEIAFTSITTVVTSLYKAGLLDRTGDRKKGYIFTPVHLNEAAFVSECLNQALTTILASYPRESGAIIVQYIRSSQNGGHNE